MNLITSLGHSTALTKIEAQVSFLTLNMSYLFVFRGFFFTGGSAVTGLFVVAKGLVFMTSYFFLSMFFYQISFSMMFFRVTDVSRSFLGYIYYWDVFTSIFPVYYCRSRVSHTTVASRPFDRVVALA